MAYNSICISSGHGLYVRGASGILDEVDEARKVVDRVAKELSARGVNVKIFHDNVSKTQNENLNRICDWHNAQARDLDVSTHFNGFEQTEGPRGTEVLWVTQSKLAADMSAAIATSGGFINRGAKKRTDLFFLNETEMPAILLEVCFVDSEADANLYRANFTAICSQIATILGGKGGDVEPPEPPEEGFLFETKGRVSHFGGPDDTGVSADEGLAFIYDVMDAPHLFLPYQPTNTTGLARRLNPYVHYVACRWDYSVTPKNTLLDNVAMVRSVRTGQQLLAFPADWGPHSDTGRVADISPSLMVDLDLATDDEVQVAYPWRE